MRQVKSKSYTVILANGEFPTRSELLDLLNHTDYLVCCDGAVESLLQNTSRLPDLIIGDGDSIPSGLKSRFADRFLHIAEQETNDLTKAFRICMRDGRTNLIILGAGGKREDHLLGNISLLTEYARCGATVRMETDYGTFFPILHSGEFASPPSGKVSIFCLDPDTEISSSGLKYPLNRLKLPIWATATLNNTTGKSFTLSFRDGAPVLLYFTR